MILSNNNLVGFLLDVFKNDTNIAINNVINKNISAITDAPTEHIVNGIDILSFVSQNNLCAIIDDGDEELFKVIKPQLKDECPKCFYFIGDIELLLQKNVAIIGTRNPSKDGIKNTRKIVADYTDNGYNIVSGMAMGIDATSHTESLRIGAKTIGVIAYPFYSYMKNNGELLKNIVNSGGLIISGTFPFLAEQSDVDVALKRRNKYIIAFSELVIPAEFPMRKSGTGSAILSAKRMGKKILGYVIENSQDMKKTKENFVAEKIEHICYFM